MEEIFDVLDEAENLASDIRDEAERLSSKADDLEDLVMDLRTRIEDEADE